MADKKMSQAEFIKNLKAQMPDLKDFSDDEIMKRVLERKPEIRERIETPADVTSRQKGHLIDPKVWENHPNIASFLRGTTGTLPGIGAVTGGLVATPGTFGSGTLMGSALGAGVGQGLRDIANQGLGLDNTTPFQKTLNIGKESAIAAVAPGAAEAVMHPVDTLRGVAGSAANTIEGMIPERLQHWVLGKWMTPEFLRSFERGGSAAASDMGTLNRPGWQSGPYTVKDMGNVAPKPGVKPTWAEGDFTEPAMDLTKTRPITPQKPGLVTTEKPLNMSVEGPPQLGPASPTRTGPDVLGNQGQIGTGSRVGPQTYVEPKQLKSEFEVTTQPIIQHSPSNSGYLRGSLDGGRTWKYSTDHGETWSFEEPQ